MDEETVKKIMSHFRKGHEILMSTDNFGNVKIKVKYGLFGLVSKRFSVDHETFAEIKKRMKRPGDFHLENG